MLHLPIAGIRDALDNGDPYALKTLMEFDCPVTVHEDGTVTEGPANLYAPDLYDDELLGDGWELLNGYSGQHGYAGPIMHPSEFIGGGMARDILDTPGTYVAVAAYYSAELTWEACGTGSVQCRHCDVWIMPNGDGGWVAEDDEDDTNSTCTHDPEDQEADGWAVARLTA